MRFADSVDPIGTPSGKDRCHCRPCDRPTASLVGDCHELQEMRFADTVDPTGTPSGKDRCHCRPCDRPTASLVGVSPGVTGDEIRRHCRPHRDPIGEGPLPLSMPVANSPHLEDWEPRPVTAATSTAQRAIAACSATLAPGGHPGRRERWLAGSNPDETPLGQTLVDWVKGKLALAEWMGCYVAWGSCSLESV
jgi:hypothetical protein